MVKGENMLVRGENPTCWSTCSAGELGEICESRPQIASLEDKKLLFSFYFFFCVWGVIFFWFPILQTTTAKPLWFAKVTSINEFSPKKPCEKRKKKHRKRRVSSESFVNMNTVPALLRPARWSFLRRRVGTWRIIPWLCKWLITMVNKSPK